MITLPKKIFLQNNEVLIKPVNKRIENYIKLL